MVEQLRMSWSGSVDTEVVRRRNDSLTEQVLPDAVDDDACRQRVIGTSQPLCEFNAATLLFRDRNRTIESTRGDETARNNVAEFLRVTLDVDLRVGWFLPLPAACPPATLVSGSLSECPSRSP